MIHAANESWDQTKARLDAILALRPALGVNDKVRIRADSQLYTDSSRVGTIIELVGRVALVDWGFTVVREHKRVPFRTHIGLVALEAL